MQKLTAFLKRWPVALTLGIVIGALIVLAIRFTTYSPHHTHYHANWAVYINGQREDFKDPAYYQEVTACQTGDAPIKPEQRAHMHDEINDVVHVHDDGVTWGDFFTNLGWYVGPDFVRTRNVLYTSTDTKTVHVILNGDDLTGLEAISRQVIGDKDRLLISFGDDDDATLQKQFKSVPATAHHYDVTKDPASCGGDEHITLKDRLNNLF